MLFCQLQRGAACIADDSTTLLNFHSSLAHTQAYPPGLHLNFPVFVFLCLHCCFARQFLTTPPVHNPRSQQIHRHYV